MPPAPKRGVKKPKKKRDKKPNPNPGPDSDREDETSRERRRNRKWLHAGLLRDVQQATQDAWYSFRTCRVLDCCDGYHIQWGADRRGRRFGNRGVGLNKIDMVTFDPEFERMWFESLGPEGTWIKNIAIVSRKHRRRVLLNHWLDPSSRDRYPEGRAQHGFLAPPVNVVHSVDDLRQGAVNYRLYLELTQPQPGPCYPSTNISLSIEYIAINLWKEDGRPAYVIVTDFLTGVWATHIHFLMQRGRIESMIESAFYSEGFRIDRAALAETNEDLRNDNESAFESFAWLNNLPLIVDEYKARMLEGYMDDMIGRGDGEDSSSEDSDGDGSGNGGGGTDGGGGGGHRNPSRGSGKRRRDSPRASRRISDLNDDNSDNDGDSQPGCRSRKKKRHGKPSHQRERRREKRSKRKQRIGSDDEDEKDELFVREPSWASPGHPGPVPGRASGSEDRASILKSTFMRNLAAVERARQASDGLNYLPDDSPLKGKGKATSALPSEESRKRTLDSVNEDEVKQEDDDDILIDEERTEAARAAKRVKYRVERTSGPESKTVLVLDSDDEDDDETEAQNLIRNDRIKIKTPSPSPDLSPTPAASLRPSPSAADSLEVELSQSTLAATSQEESPSESQEESQDTSQSSAQEGTQHTSEDPTQEDSEDNSEQSQNSSHAVAEDLFQNTTEQSQDQDQSCSSSRVTAPQASQSVSQEVSQENSQAPAADGDDDVVIIDEVRSAPRSIFGGGNAPKPEKD